MGKLKNSYILKEFGINFIFSFLIISFLFSIEGFFRIVELLLTKVFSPFIIIKFFIFSFLSILSYIIPITFLCSTTSLFTRLSVDREIIILSSSGINPIIILKKLIVFSIISSLILIYFNLTLVPIAKYKKRKIIQEVKFENLIALIKEKNSVEIIPGTTVYVEKIENKKILKNIFISIYKNGQLNILKAKEGEIKYNKEYGLIFSLKDGFFFEISGNQYFQKLKFYSYDFILSLPADYKSPIKFKLPEATIFQIKKMKIGIEEKIEINKRFIFAFTPIIFLLFGSGIGMKLKQKNKSLHLGIGAFTSLTFFEILICGEILSRKTNCVEFMWLPIFLFGIMGWILWKK